MLANRGIGSVTFGGVRCAAGNQNAITADATSPNRTLEATGGAASRHPSRGTTFSAHQSRGDEARPYFSGSIHVLLLSPFLCQANNNAVLTEPRSSRQSGPS